MDNLDIKNKRTNSESVSDSFKDTVSIIMDKLQKLTTALYRVTDLLSDKEPLKWTLRDRAIVFFDSITSIKFIKDKEEAINNSINNCFYIIKSLELVSAGTCISNINFDILKREYLRLKDFIEGKKPHILYGQKLLPDFFNLDKLEKKNKEGSYLSSANINPSPAPLGQIGEEADINPESRKGRILAFLKTNEAKTVGEIYNIFNGAVSEKAVQRDLLELVKRAKVAAKGEKRWRKYEYIDILPQIG